MDLLSVNFRPRQRFQKEEEVIHAGTFSLSSVITKKKEAILSNLSKEQLPHKFLMNNSDQEDEP